MGPFQSPSELVRPERVGLRERSPVGVSPSFLLHYVQGSEPVGGEHVRSRVLFSLVH